MKRKHLYIKLFIFSVILGITFTCKSQQNIITESEDTKTITGFSLFNKLPGIWCGPVKSSTPAGSFDKWFVDLRPVSNNQISQFSLLDANTINNYSFFIIDYLCEQRIALRTEGCFANSCCITYEILDSVNETETFYRFSDFVGGTNRAYTEISFIDNTMQMDVYTNKFNEKSKPVFHSSWKAKKYDSEQARISSKILDYPKEIPVIDLSNSFNNMNESVFFEFNTDPYKSKDQPYTGKINLKINIDSNFNIKKDDEIEVLLTVKPLFDGLKYIKSNLNYASKSVYLTGNTNEFIINDVHPGKYYIYAFVDLNGDKLHTSGEYMSSKGIPEIIVDPENETKYEILIDMQIP